MAKNAVVISVPHQIQGPKLRSYRPDPEYRRWIKRVIIDSDFVFEEAAGHTPSHASELAEQILGPDHYVDIDPSTEQREKLGIATGEEAFGGEPINYNFWPDDGGPVEICVWTSTKVAIDREKVWVESIQKQVFQKALVICGCAHALSIARRLVDVGINVEKTWTYIPFHRLCGKCQP